MFNDPTPEQMKDAREKILSVFKALGYKPEDLNERGGGNRWNVRFRGTKEDCVIYADMGWNQSRDYDRLTFSASLPHHDKASMYGLHAPKVTVSRLKSAEQIVKDLGRRLTPDYEAVMVEARRKIKAAEDYHDAKRRNLEAVKGSNLTKEEAEAGNYRLYTEGSVYGEVKASDDSVDLDLSNVPVPVAAKIMAMIRQIQEGR